MRKKILILSVVIVLAIAAVVIVSWFFLRKEEQKEEWPIYQNSRYNFSVQYPSGWQLGEAPTNNDGRTFFSPDQEIECSAYGFYNVLTDDAGNPQTLDEFIDWLVGEQDVGARDQGSVAVLEKSETTLSGYRAEHLITKEDTTIKEAVYALGQESGRGLLCIFKSREAQATFQKNFEKMRQSFKIEANLDGEEVITGTEECVNLVNGVIVPFKDLQIFQDSQYPEVTETSREAWDKKRLPQQVLTLEAQDYQCYPMPSEFDQTPQEPGMDIPVAVTKVEWRCQLEYEQWQYFDAEDLTEKANLEKQGYTCQKEECFKELAEFGFVWLCTK